MKVIDPTVLRRMTFRQRMFDAVLRHAIRGDDGCAWEALIAAGFDFDECIREAHDLTLRLFWDHYRGDFVANLHRTAEEYGLSLVAAILA